MGALKNHPGMWLRDDAAAAFNAFEDKYGVHKVNSAGRTQGEQQHLIDRWNRGGAANRPPYLYRPADPAKTSPHVIGGGIAVDMADVGRIKDKMREFGFEWFGSGDPVHYNFRGRPNSPAARGGYQDGSSELRIFQEKLIRMGHDLGKTGADAVFGPKTKAATLHEQRMAEKNGYPGGDVKDDGVPGPSTNAYLDWWLVGRHQKPTPPAAPQGPVTYLSIQQALRRHGYNIAADGIWGPKSSNALAAFQASKGLVVDRLVGPKTRAALGI